MSSTPACDLQAQILAAAPAKHPHKLAALLSRWLKTYPAPSHSSWLKTHPVPSCYDWTAPGATPMPACWQTLL